MASADELDDAAIWLTAYWWDSPRPIVSHLKQKFSLTDYEAFSVLRKASDAISKGGCPMLHAPPDVRKPAPGKTGSLENIKAALAPDVSDHRPTTLDFQPAILIASRFRLTLPVAREVCRLAQIGGAT